jgi:hypothetical protein
MALELLPNEKEGPEPDATADQQRPDRRGRRYPYAAYLYEDHKHTLPEGCEVRGGGDYLKSRNRNRAGRLSRHSGE